MSRPTSAYLHVPFCRHRCGYCNFAVVAGREDLADRYLKALAIELSGLGAPQPVETLYLGGGTPTRLDHADLRRLLELAASWFPPVDRAAFEWTVEANPGDFHEPTLALLAEQGVTRLSLGVQSLDDAKLNRLERDHSAHQVAEVVASAHRLGLRVSVDLIFAAPQESLDDWRRDLDAAVELSVSHVSTYGLTFEKGTAFWSRRRRGDLTEVEEEAQRAMYLIAIERLAGAGYEHYEVSNFAQPGFRSRHNEAYWTGREYFAAGPGAARHVDGVRETNHRSTTTWLRRVERGESPVAERETLSPEQRARERLVFGLRRREGVAVDPFRDETGFAVDDLAGRQIDRCRANGLLEIEGGYLRLTGEGLLVSDAIWPELL